MSFNAANTFSKENLNYYLKELAKEFRKLNGKHMPAEIILIGGASILINYGFRDTTTDIDALIHASSAMNQAINSVGDKLNLPNGWLNTDFKKTSSYSPKIVQFSKYYRTFSSILTVRSVSAEYLIAMKLCAGRKYKNDLSDIIGILAEHEKQGTPITFSQIDTAVCNLYNSWDVIPKDSIEFIESAFKQQNFEAQYKKIREEEIQSKDILIDFENNYPNITSTSNVNDILTALKSKQQL